MLLEHLKKMHLHLDAQEGDRVFWFTTTGWMMWNFLVGVLLTDASIVLFDGNPGHPDLETLWQLADDAEITTFGTSASFIAGCMKAGVEPARGRDLSKLGAVGSTGSPLSPEGFAWVYEQLGSGTWLFSTSGGTDVCTAFVGGVPTLPVYRGELQARALGADLHAYGPGGEDLVGEVGELVITQPMPSMPICFWGDEDGTRLRESYFDTYPGIWRHGDWIEITERGTAIIYGRSDSTINRGGIRMGTSEIYRAVLSLDEIDDALVVDVPRDGEENWMPLFVVLAEGAALDDGPDPADRCRHPLAMLAPSRSQRGPGDRRGPAHALRQGAGGPGQADPDGNAAGAGGEPGIARQSGGARLLRRAGRRMTIGAPGFEPGTSPTRTVRATRLRHAPRAKEYD